VENSTLTVGQSDQERSKADTPPPPLFSATFAFSMSLAKTANLSFSQCFGATNGAKAKALFKAVARRRQQKTHSPSHRPSHQRARSRALKAVYVKGEQMILVEIPNIPKSRHTPPPLTSLNQPASQTDQIGASSHRKTTQETDTEPLQARNASE
jgi:hypothetical protein